MKRFVWYRPLLTRRALLFSLPLLLGASAAPAASPLTLAGVNEAAPDPKAAARKGPDPVIVRLQVLLDRAHLSPGTIDGVAGSNVAKALRCFQELRGLKPTGSLDPQTWKALTEADPEPALVEYALTKPDVEGPFTPEIPARFEDRAKLERSGYTSPLELLGEKFHMEPRLLQALNPGARFDRAGEKLVVADVRRHRPRGRAAALVVDKEARTLKALAADGSLLAFYPVSIGATVSPAPDGEYRVRAVAENPVYYYSPELAFEGVETKKPFQIAPGPNNPVGSVWIALTKDHYGIHGTPDPSRISKTYSHGCIRMTNWDAEELARLVRAGIAVRFDAPGAPKSAATRPAKPAPKSTPVEAKAEPAKSDPVPAAEGELILRPVGPEPTQPQRRP
ncbi:MAG: L,D-transpeptidase family protein [Armatimonadota bacterium]